MFVQRVGGRKPQTTSSPPTMHQTRASEISFRAFILNPQKTQAKEDDADGQYATNQVANLLTVPGEDHSRTSQDDK